MSRLGLHEGAGTPLRRGRWAIGTGALVVAAGLGTYAVLGTGSAQRGAEPRSATPARTATSARSATPASASTVGTLAPNGTYTTPSGTIATISSLRGQPTMVWFVAGGCASCQASIPAVASHLAQLRAAGLRVLTLGLYGAFASGRKGVAQLLGFGRDAASGEVITHAGWEWGMASKALSVAYDPSGTPDVYVLVGPNGHIRYRNSVPDSTMRSLLAAAKRLDAHTRTAAAVHPCC
jgi:hypothetical protein